jgi:AcrR family transcriptional regulator
MPRTSSSRSAAAPARRRPTGGRAKRRDADVLAAATKVFHRQSYADSSVQDVADELGILKGSLYYYIKTKEDLLVWLLDDVHDDVEQILDGVLARDDLGSLQKLELYVREQVLYNARNLPRISVYHHDADQLSDAPRASLRTRRRRQEQAVLDMIKDGQERGEITSDLDARVLANCVFGVVIWVYRWYRPNGRVKQEDLADACARFAVAGLTGSGDVGPPVI